MTILNIRYTEWVAENAYESYLNYYDGYYKATISLLHHSDCISYQNRKAEQFLFLLSPNKK